jgi:hypothetical protein
MTKTPPDKQRTYRGAVRRMNERKAPSVCRGFKVVSVEAAGAVKDTRLQYQGTDSK